MLQIRPNSRQVPKIRDYTGSSNYNDLLYAYLQVASIKTGSERYIEHSAVSGANLADVLGVSRQTGSKKFKALQDMGLVGPKLKGQYELAVFPSSDAALVPLDILKALVESKQVHATSLYVHMLDRYVANKQEQFNFSLTQVKEFVGIASTTYSNSHLITDAMDVLQDLGLLNYWYTIQQGETGAVNSTYMVDRVSNLLKDIC